MVFALFGTVAPAQAEEDLSSGSWYFEKGNVQDAHDAGFRGQGVTIAVVDSQINPDIAALRGADLEVVEPSFCRTAEGAKIPTVSTDPDVAYHGTGVVTMIIGTGKTDPGQLPIRGVAPDAKVIYYNGVAGTSAESEAGDLKCFEEDGENRGMDGVGRAIDAAVTDGADIVSISISGGTSTTVNEAIARAYAEGVVVVTSLPNNRGAADFPATNNGVIAVQAFDEAGEIQKGDKGIDGAPLTPNTSDSVVVGAPGMGVLQPAADPAWQLQDLGNGTSIATPIVAGFLAVLKSKFPEATGNQLLQTMLHNTGGERHEMRWGNDFGYGAISLTSMLTDDPLSYPDVNPLFNNPQFELNSIIGPTAEDVQRAADATPTLSPEASSTASPTQAASEDSGSPGLLWAVGGGVLGAVALGGALVPILMNRASRRRRAAATMTQQATTDEGGHDIVGQFAGEGDDGGDR